MDAIRSAASRRRARVGVGTRCSTPALLDSIGSSAQFADVVSVGAEVERVESIREDDEQAAAEQLVRLAQSGAVDAIVRGQLDYSAYHRAVGRVFRVERDLMCPCLLRDGIGNEWFITPVVHHDDASVGGRVYLGSQAAEICRVLGVEPRIGVLAADSERGYLPQVDRSLDEAEAIARALRGMGYESEVYPLRIDLAASQCTVVVPMDGILGNFVCRSLGYLGGGTLVGGFTLTRRFVSLDTSRFRDQFAPGIAAAAAMANLGGMPVREWPAK